MGTWLYGWIEVRSRPVSPTGWRPLLKTNDVLELKGWWRIPIFGRSRLIDDYFDPLPFTHGIPDDLSATVNLEVTDWAEYEDPEQVGRYIYWDDLKAVDWNEPRNNVGHELKELSWPSYRNEYRTAYKLQVRDSSWNIVDDPRHWGHFSLEEAVEIVEDGPIEEDGKYLCAVAPTRREYLPPAWFKLVDFVDMVAEKRGDENIRLLFWLDY